MTKKSEIIAEKRAEVKDLREKRGEHASELARKLAIGVVAIVWGILALGKGDELLASSWQVRALLLSGVVAILSLCADWAQAIFWYMKMDSDYERVFDEDFDPDSGTFALDRFYSLVTFLFWTKQFLSPLSVVLLIACLLPTIGSFEPTKNKPNDAAVQAPNANNANAQANLLNEMR